VPHARVQYVLSNIILLTLILFLCCLFSGCSLVALATLPIFSFVYACYWWHFTLPWWRPLSCFLSTAASGVHFTNGATHLSVGAPSILVRPVDYILTCTAGKTCNRACLMGTAVGSRGRARLAASRQCRMGGNAHLQGAFLMGRILCWLRYFVPPPRSLSLFLFLNLFTRHIQYFFKCAPSS
jgi:hypothetical protein